MLDSPRATTSPQLWEMLKPLARQMRHEPTPAEDLLWRRLRSRRLYDTRFRRQHAIERFIVDFYCADARLIVEVDGVIHEYTQEEDAIRQEYLESLGFMVIRFTNGDVVTSLGAVVERIGEVLVERLPPR